MSSFKLLAFIHFLSLLAIGCSSNNKSGVVKVTSKLVDVSLSKEEQKGTLSVDSIAYGFNDLFVTGSFASQEPITDLNLVLKYGDGVRVFTTSQEKEDDKIKFSASIPWDLIPQSILSVGIAIKSGTGNELTYQMANKIVYTVAPKKFPFVVSKKEVMGSLDTRKEFPDWWVLEGWAFPKGISSKGAQKFIVLISENDSLFFEAYSSNREDVAGVYPQEASSLESGYFAVVPKSKLVGAQNYRVGILIKQGSDFFYKSFDGYVKSLSGNFKFHEPVTKNEIANSVNDDGSMTIGNIDATELFEKGISVTGWASAVEPDAANVTYVQFTSPQDTVVVKASLVSRPDVASALKKSSSIKYGFYAVVSRSVFKQTTYLIRPVIKTSNQVIIAGFSKEFTFE